MREDTADTLFILFGIIVGLALALGMLTGCAGVQRPGPTAPEARTNIELDDASSACEHAPAHRMRAQHTPIRTRAGDVWCF